MNGDPPPAEIHQHPSHWGGGACISFSGEVHYQPQAEPGEKIIAESGSG